MVQEVGEVAKAGEGGSEASKPHDVPPDFELILDSPEKKKPSAVSPHKTFLQP
jgi:hypothetical protein